MPVDGFMDRMEFKHPRRLVFQTHDALGPPAFNGWFCERCCWSVRLTDITRAPHAQELFEQHDCEAFARDNWRRMSPPSGGAKTGSAAEG